nr:endonuclease MutS2 [Deinobacterium chartae]
MDFPRIRQALAERCATRLGAERAEHLVPGDDERSVQLQLDQVEDALFGVSLQLGGISDIRTSVSRAREGRTLLGSEILEVAYTLDAAMTLKRSVAQHSRGPLLDLAESIGSHVLLVRSALEKLDRDGAVRDDASPKLRQLRRRMNPLRNEIRERLTQVMERWSEMLQENIVTQRRDRFVLPIKAAYVNQVQGIVLDQSATGQTYFVEPAQVVPLNNELAKIILEEEEEVRRILQELSALIAGETSIDTTLRALAEFDLIRAKATLARDWKLGRPERSERGRFRIEGARHPLIENAVANDLTLDDHCRLLLITGPNMGGKTATLKTLGLIVAMHQCGMYVPASRAELPNVRDILVDIGDDQSIEASLSTFAAHLVNLRRVLDSARPDTLILVDELGSGTDPSEGAALSQAILGQLLQQGARGIVTSHLAPLKLYAMETPGLQNASMGFDVERLSPTYRLQVGQPGRSYALAIARRLGMPEGIMREAEAILGPEGGRLERLLENLERERERLRQDREAAERLVREAEANAEALRLERDGILSERDAILAKAQERAEQVYAEAFEQVRTLRQRSRDEAARPRVLEELKELRRASQAARPQPKPEPALEQLRVGSTVEVPAYGATGQVLEVRGEDLVVQMGVLKVNVRRRDVRLKQESKVKVMTLSGGPSSFNKELNLRGEHAEEALEHLRSFIVEAHALHETPLRVVHGKGQGVLRRLIRDYLKNERLVESFHDAEPYAGGHGVTIIHVRK